MKVDCGVCYENINYNKNKPLENYHFTCIQCLNHMCLDCIVNMKMYLMPIICPYCREIDMREYLGYYGHLSESVLNEIRKVGRYNNKKNGKPP